MKGWTVGSGGSMVPDNFVDQIGAHLITENPFITDQMRFDIAKRHADRSWWARFCASLWYVPWLPERTRKWGMGVWNARYREALPRRLRATR